VCEMTFTSRPGMCPRFESIVDERENALRRFVRDLAMLKSMPCPRCHDARWVCEDHMHRPWGIPRGCACGGAGAPCPVQSE
jgi:hypothetical protein